ncbi:zinc finger protein 556-like [Ptychodera flava]|uniref:zinc finger protein 556-like n=1 Tax=Ptychodera flava TaxID=63121 RepID=UPI00396A8C4A
MDFTDAERPDDESSSMKADTAETPMVQSESPGKLDMNDVSPQNLVVKREPNWEDEVSEDSGCQGEENNHGDGANGNHAVRRRNSSELEMEEGQDENKLAFLQNYPRKYTIRRFICELCGIEIRHTAKYERHMFEMHNVTMPYKCNKCSGKRFMRLIQLQVHEDKMHSHKPVETRRKWTQRQFQCPVCQEKITYVAKYQQHMILEHGVMRMFDCRVCGHAMGHYHQYQDHMRTYHPNASVKHYSETESLTNSGSAMGQHSDEGT